MVDSLASEGGCCQPMIRSGSPQSSSVRSCGIRRVGWLVCSLGLLASYPVVERAGAADLYIGTTGTPETVTISSGTNIYQTTSVGYSGASSNNLLVVTGSGTQLTNSLYLWVGRPEAGGNNQVLVTNGASLRSGSYTWIGDTAGNSVVVTGSGTTYANNLSGGGYFKVGSQGNSNSFTASSGATVSVGSEAAIGYSSGSSFNLLLVTDSGTSFTSSTNILVGMSGSSNNLTVSNGGTMSVVGFTSLGHSNTSVGNSALITGANSLYTNSERVFIGYEGAGNSLTVSSGGTVRAATNTFLGTGSASTGNSLLVTGAGSLYTNSRRFYIGYAGASNSFTVSEGGIVRSSGDYNFMGYESSSLGNTVLVTGSGSLFTNSGDLYVGFQGASNGLTVSDGGTVRVATDTYIGTYSTSSNSTALVAGTGALLTNTGEIVVGYEASGNSLVVSNGGTVVGSIVSAGYLAAASNNALLVTGAGSMLTAANTLRVGYEGRGTATVTDGGSITAASNIVLAVSNGSTGVLNIGRFGTNDSAGSVTTPAIQFGAGTGTVNFNQTNSYTLTAAITGTGTVNQLGSGTTTLSGSSTSFSTLVIQGGMLRLNVSSGPAVNASVSVAAGGTLFLMSANQVADTAAVTLSGGTIFRGSGVSEQFGNLTLSADSTLNFGGTAENQFLRYRTLTLNGFVLEVADFLEGNKLQYDASSYEEGELLAETFEFTDSDARAYSWSEDTFTIEAIPEPSTAALVAAAALAGLLWGCMRRRQQG